MYTPNVEFDMENASYHTFIDVDLNFIIAKRSLLISVADASPTNDPFLAYVYKMHALFRRSDCEISYNQGRDPGGYSL